MNQTLMSLLLTLLVIGHTLVEALHGIAHQQLGVGLSGLQFDYVLWVIVIAPLAAISLFWAGLRAPGLLLLLTSMAGSLVFGLYYHFWFAGPDNALMVVQANGAALFQATAIVLVWSRASHTFSAFSSFLPVCLLALEAKLRSEVRKKRLDASRSDRRLLSTWKIRSGFTLRL